MELSDTFADPVAISIAGVRRSYMQCSGVIQIAYTIDLAVRIFFLFSDGTVFVDFSEAACEIRGERQTCFEGEIIMFVMKWWLQMELALNCGKGLGMLLVFSLLAFLKHFGRLDTVFAYLQKAIGFQQTLTFLSIFLFIFYFAGVHSYLGKATKHVYSATVVVSVLPFLFAEVVRRRLEGLHMENRQLMVRENARARADGLPRVRYADVANDPSSFQESGCSICLADFSDDEMVAKLACGHVFHVSCIRIWLAGGFQFGCPMRCDVPAPAPAPATLGASAASRRRRRRRQHNRVPSLG
jgi:hypothetical protein